MNSSPLPVLPALIAAVLGFSGIAAGAAGIAKVLFVVFLTGSLGVFDDPITRWMKPHLPQARSLNGMDDGVDRPLAVRLGQAYLNEHQPQAHSWGIALPDDDDRAVRLFWQDANEQFHNQRIDALTYAMARAVAKHVAGFDGLPCAINISPIELVATDLNAGPAATTSVSPAKTLRKTVLPGPGSDPFHTRVP